MAATVVIAITGTALPVCRLFAETVSPTKEATMMTSTRGWTKTVTTFSPKVLVCALIAVSETAQKSPAEAPRATPMCLLSLPATPTAIASAATAARNVHRVSAS